MDYDYIKIKSWHIIKTPTRMFDTYITRCGLKAVGNTANDLPLGEKSCESCFRYTARDAERAVVV